MSFLDQIQWNEAGLVPVVVQEVETQDVIMFAWMNRQALEQTLEKGEAVFYSRSRQKIWRKGETSGHVQRVHGVFLDCDGDALLLKVTQTGHVPGIACHTGRHSCFFNQYQDGQWQEVLPVLKDPKEIYGR